MLTNAATLNVHFDKQKVEFASYTDYIVTVEMQLISHAAMNTDLYRIHL